MGGTDTLNANICVDKLCSVNQIIFYVSYSSQQVT